MGKYADMSDIMARLNPVLKTYGGGVLGTSFADEWRNANAGLRELKAMQDIDGNSLSDTDRTMLQKGMRSMKGNAFAGAAMAGLTGAAQLLGNASEYASIGDTTVYQDRINSLYDIGTANYNNFDQLANDYNNAVLTTQIDKDAIRGMTTGQKWGAIGSSALTGASTGAAIGGPWGAAAGAAIGGLAAGFGILEGNRKAEMEYATLQNSAQRAASMARLNLDAAHDRVADMNFRTSVANVAARGGKVERKQQTITEFADKVLRAQRENDRTHSAGLMHRKCKGGTMVRIKTR